MPTLKDIAEVAGVDVSIVSRVLNGGQANRAGPAKRAKILRVAREMNYEPNAMARSLVRSQSDLIGLIVPDLYEPAFLQYQETLDQLMGSRGRMVLPFISHWSPEREAGAMRLARQKFLDGILCLHCHSGNIAHLDELRKRGVPVVLREVGEASAHTEFDSVVVDIMTGGYALTMHLFAQGYERVALMGGFAAEEIASGKAPHGLAVGYIRAHEEFGKPVEPGLSIPCRDDGSDACEALEAFLGRHPGGVDAILVQSNVKLPGVYRALRRLGLRVGPDIGLATVTDSIYCHLTETPVTVWHQPIESICEGLVELLDRRLANRKAPPSHLHFKSQLIPRESTTRTQKQERTEP